MFNLKKIIQSFPGILSKSLPIKEIEVKEGTLFQNLIAEKCVRAFD